MRLLVMFALATILVGALLQCSPDDTVPLETVAIRIDARDPFNARPEGPLRVALLWTTTGTIYASRSVVLAEDQNTVELPLAYPEPRPVNLFFAELALVTGRIVVNVPRIVIFRDDNDSGEFDVWNLDDPPTDRIFGINTQGTTAVAAVRDFDSALAGLPAVDVNTYYDLTDGINTDFLRFVGATSTLTPSMLNRFGPPIASLYFEESELPERDIRCVNTRGFQVEPELLPITALGTSSRTVSIRVDPGIDVESVCGLTVPDCVPTSTPTMTATVPLTVRTDGRRVLSQCRSGARFESLITLDAVLRCGADCNCGWEERQRVRVVRTSSTPPGWPCGDAVDYCPSSLPLYLFDEACELEAGEDEDDG